MAIKWTAEECGPEELEMGYGGLTETVPKKEAIKYADRIYKLCGVDGQTNASRVATPPKKKGAGKTK